MAPLGAAGLSIPESSLPPSAHGSFHGSSPDLTVGWNPAAILLVLGAAYVGSMDDLAVWNRALSPEEIARLHALPGGVETLRR